MASVGVKRYEYRVPRSFRLRQELEFAEKGASMESKSNQAGAAAKPKDQHAMFVSFGLGDLDDTSYDNQLSNWNGTIIGPQNVHSHTHTHPRHTARTHRSHARTHHAPHTRTVRPLMTLLPPFPLVYCGCVQTSLGERIYNLRMKCGPRYPDVPPTVHFVQKINMPGVDPLTGLVNHAVIMKTWNRNNTMSHSTHTHTHTHRAAEREVSITCSLRSPLSSPLCCASGTTTWPPSDKR